MSDRSITKLAGMIDYLSLTFSMLPLFTKVDGFGGAESEDDSAAGKTDYREVEFDFKKVEMVRMESECTPHERLS